MLYVMTDYHQTFTDRSNYLTAGKLYHVVAQVPHSDLYTILDDRFCEISVPVGRTSSHLNGIGVFKLFELVERSA